MRKIGNYHNEDVLERKRRQDIIINIINQKEIKTHIQLVEELKNRGIQSSQSTVSRDLEELKISKSGVKRKYIIQDLKDYHLVQIKDLIQKNKSQYFPRISQRYLKTGEGDSSVYANHLKKAFPVAILDVTIREDSLLLLINEEDDEENLKELDNLFF
jgi:arginine repressor